MQSSDSKMLYWPDRLWICCQNDKWVKSKVDDKPHLAQEDLLESLATALLSHITFSGTLTCTSALECTYSHFTYC